VNTWLANTIEQLDRGWVWLYTAGMKPAAAAERRDELESDQWEMSARARAENWTPAGLARQLLGRWLLGIPSDLSWRLAAGRRGFSKEGLTDLVAAPLFIGGVSISLPLGVFLALQRAGFDGHDGSRLLLIISVPTVSLLCVGGVLLQELRRVVGTAIVITGALSLSLILWWTVTVPLIGLLGAAGAIYRSGRLNT